MSQLTFLLYILSQSVGSIRPIFVLRLKEWHERFSAEEIKFEPKKFAYELGLKPQEAEKFIELYESIAPERLEQEFNSIGIFTVNIFKAD